MSRLGLRLLAATLLLGQNPSIEARPYTVDDLLRTEDIGDLTFDPRGRWLVFERLEPILAMSRFDMLGRASVLRSRLYVVDLERPKAVRPLLPSSMPGMIAYGFSPDGSRLAIGRLNGDRWRLGIVTMKSGAVRWFGLSPAYDPFRTSVGWISPDRLVAIVDPTGQRPWWLRSDGYPADILPARWRTTRLGASASVTTVGSGRFREAGPKAPRNQLVMVDARTRRVSLLATGRFISLNVAAGGGQVALIEQGRPVMLPQDRPVSQIDTPYARVPLLLDLAHRKVWRPCDTCDALERGAWSADGQTFAIFARRNDEDWDDGQLIAIDIRSKTLTRPFGMTVIPAITDMPDGSTRVAFRWRGSGLMIYGRARAGLPARPGWYVMRAGRLHSLTAGLSAVSADVETLNACANAMNDTDGFWCLDAAGPVRLSEPGLFPSNGWLVGWKAKARAVSISGDILAGHSISKGPDEHLERLVAAPTGTAIIAQRVATNGVRTMALITPDRVDTIVVENGRLGDVRPAQAHPLIHESSEGRAITSWFLLPATVQHATRLPLVVIPYPGTTYGSSPPMGQSIAAARFYTNAQLLAGRGYAVLLPSLPPSANRENDRSSFVRDVDLAVDAAVATGVVDAQRMALWGHSYGGYAVAMIAERSCRFASAIASAGIYDPAAILGTFGPVTRIAPEHGLFIGANFAWAETGQGRLGVPPWSDPSRYLAVNPLYHADRIRIPMLIFAADRDPSPVEQAQQLFAALSRQNKDAELVTYWGEGHVVGSPGNVRDMYARVFDWLDVTLSRPNAIRCPSSGSSRASPARSEPIAP